MCVSAPCTTLQSPFITFPPTACRYRVFLEKYTYDRLRMIMHTVFPRIVSAETILFWIWPYVLWPLVTVHKSAETIQGRKLFKGGNYSRKYGIYFFILLALISDYLMNQGIENCKSCAKWRLNDIQWTPYFLAAAPIQMKSLNVPYNANIFLPIKNKIIFYCSTLIQNT